ncbi:MAG: hypothetical protein ACFFAL_11030 [Promethearchaeota archaeon]
MSTLFRLLRIISVITVTILIVIPLNPMQVSAALVWNEDFTVTTVEELDDWVLQGYELIDSTFYQVDHGFTIVNGELTAEDVYVPWSIYMSQVRRAIHNSTVAYGTWSFDWRVSGSQNGYDGVEFMFTDLRDEYNLTGEFTSYAMTGYTLILDTIENDEMYIEKFAVTHGVILVRHDFPSDLIGQHHIDVTRSLEGEFNVYFDSQLVLNVIDADVTSCEKFNFVSFQGNSSIDNIVISDSVDVARSELPIELIVIGIGIGVTVVAIVIFFKRKK